MEEFFEPSLFSKPFLSAVIVAAGSSVRMGGGDKIFMPVAGIPVVARSLLAYENCEDVSEIVVVTKETSIEEIKKLSEEYKISKLKTVVPGGATRAESVKNGVLAVSAEADFVAIHDGARPLVLPEDISRCAHDAFCCGGAVLAVPVTDTIKYGKKNGFVEYTPAREKLFAAQTPQIFDINIYKSAMERAFRELSDWTDDSRIFENDARKVFLTPGKKYNIKITSPEDILIAEALLKGRDSE
ncbi:MAG: 2-C-methyl-D-erythritol 4-phosphate cytidylyltransferase [Oscillospiraceae bacterium]|nr:2-C-methyl-D-erythritol 4-phosphate cytidylyltransferase [Oscillospiraceae bacterium]